MNKLRIIIPAFCAVCSLLSAHAQGLVQFPTGSAAWTVDIVPYTNGHAPPATATAGPAFEIKKMDVTKVNGVTRSVVNWKDGRTTERWSYDQFQFMILTETYNGQPTILSGEDIQFGGQFAVSFEPSGFKWLDPSRLKDMVQYQGKKCLHYQGDVTVSRTQSAFYGGPSKRIDIVLFCEAWIDKDTLLPVAFYDGSKLGVFTFNDPPNGPLVPPPAIKKMLDHYIAVSRPLK